MEVHRNGPNYVLILTHEDILSLNTGGTVVAAAAPEIAPIISGMLGVLNVMDFLGGNNGVEICGSIGSPYTIVLPQGKGVWGTILRTVADIAKFAIMLTNPIGLLVFFGIPKLLDVIGTPAGHVHCSADAIRDHETFSMITTSNDKVGILSHRGFFTADGDDRLVYANRDQLLRCEEWNLIKHPDGRVSFQSWMGTFMCADRNRGKRVSADRPPGPSEWEKFTIHFLGDGKIAMQESEGKFVSVA